MARTTKTQQAESIRALTDPEIYGLQPEDTLYTSHHNPDTYLKVFIIRHQGGTPYIANITWHVARAIGETPRDWNGEWFIRNGVIGMDRGFDIVYRLSRTLFDDDPESYGDSGYALNHRWL